MSQNTTTSLWDGKQWVNWGIKIPDRIIARYTTKQILENKAQILREIEEERGRNALGPNWRNIAAGIGDQ